MKAWVILLLLALAGCRTVPTQDERRLHADTLAARHGYQAISIPAKPFTLMSYVPIENRFNETLSIYIEGDGFSWRTRSQPSDDPTPLDPLALRLALEHPGGNAAYLARPCQFVDAQQADCAEHYWTNKRFAPEVIEATNQAIDALKTRFKAQRLVLVGYSGGAAVAALVAAQRSDVTMLVTVAGNLDHRAWTTHHHLQPLSGSLNPADAIGSLRKIKQWHYVGGRDQVVPPELGQAFAARFASKDRVAISVEPDFDHRCCWAESWPKLWQRIMNNP